MPVDVAIVATHIAPAKGYGGIAECTERVARQWAVWRRSFRLCASDASTDGPLAAAAVAMPAAVTVDLYRAHWFPRLGFGLGAPWRILRACLGARAVYVSGIATWPTTLAGLLCRLLRRRFVVSPHGGLLATHVAEIRRTKPHKWLFYKLITLPTLRAADAIHATSAFEADGVLRLLPSAPVAVIGNGLDLGVWSPLPLRPPCGGRVFCYIGRLSAEKGIRRFLALWLEVRGPRDRLLIAGDGHDAYGRDVERLVDGSGGAVELLGYLDQNGVRDVLARSDVLVLPSGIESDNERENFGNVVAEALASGRPAVVTRGLAWDDIEAGGVGFLLDRTDEAIRDTIRRVQALEAVDFARMGQAARRYAEARLDVRGTAERMWDLVTGRRPAADV